MKTRFAPSPTGWLHLGHALAARAAWQWARENHGEFLLRFEDIDSTRVREFYYQGIEDDLRWLELDWCGEALRQTQRMEAYREALLTLQNAGAVYPCFCTRREVEQEWLAMGGAPHRGEEIRYPGTCRKLSAGDIAQKMADGLVPCWRLDGVKARELCQGVVFHDRRFGRIEVCGDSLGDVILARKDLGTSYHLAVVVDDAWQEITHVSRGEDLLASTHVHVALQHWLGLPQPQYWHHEVMVDEQGVRLAKRHDSLALRTLRENGAMPSEVWQRIDEKLGKPSFFTNQTANEGEISQ